MDVVALLLPNPKKLIEAGLKSGPANREDREFLGEVVGVHDSEFLDGVGRGSIFPVRADGKVGVPDSFLEDLVHVFNEDFIGVTHGGNYNLKRNIAKQNLQKIVISAIIVGMSKKPSKKKRKTPVSPIKEKGPDDERKPLDR